jgi:amino acid adenylation domain-containing protein
MLVNEFLEYSARIYPDKVALVCRGQRLTYKEIDNASSAIARSLVNEGFQRHDRGVIYLDNCLEAVISLFGILKAGGIFVIVNPKVKDKKLAYIISDCQAKILVSDWYHLKQKTEAFSDLSCLDSFLIIDSEKYPELEELGNRRILFYYDELASNISSSAIISRSIDIDLAGLIYTSGSSGTPKGVMLTHHNMVSAAESIIRYLGNTSEDIVINTLPLAFDYGLYQVLMTFKFGGTIILENGFIFPEQIMNLIVKEKVTGWPIVPTIAAILCRQSNLVQHDFSRLRYISSTGQVLFTNHIARLQKSFPNVKIFSMYGLTECKRVLYLPPDELLKRPASVGKAMPNTEAFIVDKDNVEIFEAETPGELVVRGANVMQGYWNLPEDTARALRPGRYPFERVLYTGDLFKKDNEGFLYFLGRKDDMIKTSGLMVSPKEIENVLCEIDDVVEAAVIGVEDEILGQAIKAFIHLNTGCKVTEKDVINYCRKHLEDQAIPKYVEFCDSLPKNESEKIQKKVLQQRIQGGNDNL